MEKFLDYEGLSELVEQLKAHAKPWIGVDSTAADEFQYLNIHGQFVKLPEMTPTEVTDLMNSLQNL